MNELQTTITVILALIIGFVLGRGSKKSDAFVEQNLTQEEWNSLQPKSTENNPPQNEDFGEVETEHTTSKTVTNSHQNLHPNVFEAIQSNNKIVAIKRFREHHGGSLKEAKNAVDALLRQYH